MGLMLGWDGYHMGNCFETLKASELVEFLAISIIWTRIRGLSIGRYTFISKRLEKAGMVLL